MKKEIRICHGKSCGQSAKNLMNTAQQKVKRENLGSKIIIDQCHCMGECQKGPNMQVIKDSQKEVKNSVSPRSLERQIDILSGKEREILQKPGEAKNTLNSLLSGGF